MTRERTRRTPTPTAPAPEAGRAPADAAQASSEPPAMTARPASQLVILLADATVDMRAAMTPLGANITGWAQDAVGAVNEFAMLFPEIAAYGRGSSRARNPDTTEVRDQLVLVQYGEAERVFAELCHRISQRAATLSVPDSELLDQMDLGARLFEENIARADSAVVGHGLWVPLQNYRTAAQTLRQRRTGAAPTATPRPARPRRHRARRPPVAAPATSVWPGIAPA
ncbi:MAG: hypothetical protein U1F43_30160 [Myxococcota bacterium]